jgi:hypothetical protein
MSHISVRGEQSDDGEILTLTNLTNLAISGDGQAIKKTGLYSFENVSVGSGSAVWGSITGTLSNQADLTAVLASKESLGNKSNDINLGVSVTNYPTQYAVKTYVDTISSYKFNVPDNIVQVKTGVTEVAGKIYNTIASALAYIATQTPATDNRWGIMISGENSEDFTIPSWVAIIGDATTDLSGAVSAVTPSDIDEVNIVDCLIRNLNFNGGTGGLITRCQIKGGTFDAGSIIYAIQCTFRDCDVDVIYDGSAFINCFLGGTGTLPADGTCYNSVVFNLGAGTVLAGGRFFTTEFDGSAFSTDQTLTSNLEFKNCSMFGVALTIIVPNGVTFTVEGCDMPLLNVTVEAGGTLTTYNSTLGTITNAGTWTNYGATYDNRTSGLTAGDVQSAIDELALETSNTEDGTADGQMLFWNNVASEWQHTETSELFWDDTTKKLYTTGDFEVAKTGTLTNFSVSDNIIYGHTANADNYIYIYSTGLDLQGGTTQIQLSSGYTNIITDVVDIYNGGSTTAVSVYGTLLVTSSFTIGSGAAGVDYTLTFNGETNDIVLTAMEDEKRLDLTGSFGLSATTNADKYGIIYKGSNAWLHDFNYGNNGTVTTLGYNTFLGIQAGNLTMGSTATSTAHASYNTGIGYGALYGLTRGYSNTALGYFVLKSCTEGYNNSAFGRLALTSLTDGYNTMAFGYQAGRFASDGTTENTSPTNSVYIGVNTRANANSETNQNVIGYATTGKGSNTNTIGNTNITNSYIRGNLTIGQGTAGTDYTLTFDGETNDGVITWMEDEDYFKFDDSILFPDSEPLYFGTGVDMSIDYDGSVGNIKTDLVAASDLHIDCGTAKTVVLDIPVYKDANVGALILSTGGTAPGVVQWLDNDGDATGIYTVGFADGEQGSGCIEIPHDYQEGTDLVFHLHYGINDAPTGTDKIRFDLIYNVQRDGQTFADSTTVDSTDVSVDTQYMTGRIDFAAITGTNFKIGDQFNFTIKRTTAVGDAFAGEVLVQSVGFHYKIDTLGSRSITAK